MPRRPPPLLLLASMAMLAGCSTLLAQQGGRVSPSLSLQRPSLSALPPEDRYVDLADAWRRQARVGMAGYAEATLWDPLLAAAEVAHEGAFENLGPTARRARLRDRWETWYGLRRDRFPIDVDWRFDTQFYSDHTVLAPARWTFTLQTDDGRAFAPLAVSRLDHDDAPRNGYYEGRLRLWFPWRAEAGTLPILGGQTSGVTLTLKSAFGEGAFTWRFHNARMRG